MKLKHFVSAIAIILIALAVYSCSKSSTTPQQPPVGSNAVSEDIYNMAFPGTITVKVGTKVTWNNKDGYAHTVTSDDGTSFNSGSLAGGASFSYVAATAGTITYHCNFHSNMKSTLIVTN
ncbi:MAG TPA: cupredoxin domain-containing protein [Hanamia sp.]|jgi:plastocyanin|nr:cupredoxin domain-containing protein [Hanamia sp.]